MPQSGAKLYVTTSEDQHALEGREPPRRVLHQIAALLYEDDFETGGPAAWKVQLHNCARDWGVKPGVALELLENHADPLLFQNFERKYAKELLGRDDWDSATVDQQCGYLATLKKRWTLCQNRRTL